MAKASVEDRDTQHIPSDLPKTLDPNHPLYRLSGVEFPTLRGAAEPKRNLFTEGVGTVDVDLASMAEIEMVNALGMFNNIEMLMSFIAESPNFRRAYLDFIHNGGSENNNHEALLRLCARFYVAGVNTRFRELYRIGSSA